jgi:hypothetical protein
MPAGRLANAGLGIEGSNTHTISLTIRVSFDPLRECYLAGVRCKCCESCGAKLEADRHAGAGAVTATGQGSSYEEQEWSCRIPRKRRAAGTGGAPASRIRLNGHLGLSGTIKSRDTNASCCAAAHFARLEPSGDVITIRLLWSEGPVTQAPRNCSLALDGFSF